MKLNIKICRHIFLLACLTIICCTKLFSQEQLIPLQNNPAYLNAEKPTYRVAKKALSLPFFDDFSTTEVYPDPMLWTDSTVYINRTLAKNPPTMGVASFDGLNGEGQPWSPANVGEEDTRSSLLCDMLTAQPIDLSNVNDPKDLFLSFFYQPGGNASKPEIDDSLLLEVKTNADEWETIWRHKGVENQEFKSVLLHLGDSAKYLHPDFQFRFINYATPTGYNDFWHIDYVDLSERNSISSETVKLNDPYYILVKANNPDCKSVEKNDFDLSDLWTCETNPVQLINDRGDAVNSATFSEATLLPEKGSVYISTIATNIEFGDPRAGNVEGECEYLVIYNRDSVEVEVDITNYSITNDCLPSALRDRLDYKDLAFVEEPTSILRDYSEMTLNQFYNYQDLVMNESHSFTISNLDDDVFPSDYDYQIILHGENEIVYNPIAAPISLSVPEFERYTQNIANTFRFTNNPRDTMSSSDTTWIYLTPDVLSMEAIQVEMKYFLNTEDNNDENLENDTISRMYTFNNQLAYDDGIIDVGYGVSGESAQIAQKYEIYERDFVYGVLIHFAQITLNQTDRFFTLKLWESIKGVEDADTTILLTSIPDLEVLYPEGDNHTGYVLYCFEDGIPVKNQFYVGIQQEGSIELHLGFDRNNDSKDKLFFNTFNEWASSKEEGSVMIRPVIGRPLDLEEDCNIVTVCPVLGKPCTDVNGNESVYDEDCLCPPVMVSIFDHPTANLAFTILPNPANDYITLANMDKSLQNSSTIEIIDATGKLTKSFDSLSESLYIGDLADGIYFIRITNDQQQFAIMKLIKTE